MPSHLIWEIPKKEKALYLTFDDGPVAGITDETLALLDRFNAKATFFCVGDNVIRNPETYSKIIDSGHSVGNHTFHHLNGWKTTTEDYIRDIEKCSTLVDSNLFRPPYGRITRKQANILSKNYKITMWSVLSGDFDPSVTVAKCIRNVERQARPGSIIVMHDQIKSAATMLQALPVILDLFQKQGFSFEAMSCDRNSAG